MPHPIAKQHHKQHYLAATDHYSNAAKPSSSGGDAASKVIGVGKAFFHLARAGVSEAMAALSLRITITSLTQGVHVECKSMDELFAAEIAIIEAAQNLRAYIDTAETFDGEEVVLEF